MTCGVDGCISAAAVALVMGVMSGCWALGYAMGKTVSWVRAISAAA
jgi:hypothetical protein